VPPYWFQPYQRNRSKPVRHGILRLGQAHAAGRVSCRRSAGNHCLPGGLEFRELGKASDMKKAVLVLATAATIGITALVTPSPAQAWRGGWGAGPAGGVIAGTVIGGIVAGVPALGPGYCYYRGPSDYYPRGAYYGHWCYMGYQYGR
jgi:hypothetical protein